jgi:hypothetical protein
MESDADVARCQACGKTRPHTIQRLNRPGRPVLCDDCHEGDAPRRRKTVGKTQPVADGCGASEKRG